MTTPTGLGSQLAPICDAGYFEMLTRAVFQAGFRPEIVDARWPAFRTAFQGFDVDAVAAFGRSDVERLLADDAIVRNSRKIEATVRNAIALQALVREHGSVRAWLRTTADLPWPERVAVVAGTFRGIGPDGARAFLGLSGEAVPQPGS